MFLLLLFCCVFLDRRFFVIGDMLFVNIFMTFVMIVAVSCHGGKRARCRPQRGFSEIRVLGCETVKIVSKGCAGRCSSSAIPKIMGVTDFTKTCSCCFPTKSITKYVKLKCGNGKDKTITLPQATKCKCRPC